MQTRDQIQCVTLPRLHNQLICGKLGKIMMELRSEHQLAQEFVSKREETTKSSDILHSPNDSVFVTDNQAEYEKHKQETACRSSSVPVRKSPKDISSNVSKEGMKKYLTQKLTSFIFTSERRHQVQRKTSKTAIH